MNTDQMYDKAPSEHLIELRKKWRAQVREADRTGDRLRGTLLKAAICRASTTLKNRGIGEDAGEEGQRG